MATPVVFIYYNGAGSKMSNKILDTLLVKIKVDDQRFRTYDDQG